MRITTTKQKDIEQKWYLLDAENMVLGRLASVAAQLLIGKHKPYYTGNLDVGDYVVIINADKVAISGKKAQQKLYRHHSGYQSGLKEISYNKLMQKDPTRIIKHAVWGMMPKGKLGRKMFKKLKVYAGDKHEHQAQKPIPYNHPDLKKNIT